MYLVKKGAPPNQAHVGVPDGLHEEEHGRQGFSGPSSHLYHHHPPTAWSRIDGPLRPRAFTCTELPTPDCHSADGRPTRTSCAMPTGTKSSLCIEGAVGGKRTTDS